MAFNWAFLKDILYSIRYSELSVSDSTSNISSSYLKYFYIGGKIYLFSILFRVRAQVALYQIEGFLNIPYYESYIKTVYMRYLYNP